MPTTILTAEKKLSRSCGEGHSKQSRRDGASIMGTKCFAGKVRNCADNLNKISFLLRFSSLRLRLNYKIVILIPFILSCVKKLKVLASVILLSAEILVYHNIIVAKPDSFLSADMLSEVEKKGA